MENPNSIASPVAKTVTAWALIGITSWAEAASFVAFVYSCCLLAEWVWKRIIRKALVRRGILAPLPVQPKGDDE